MAYEVYWDERPLPEIMVNWFGRSQRKCEKLVSYK